jgi:hypothetical protein
MLWGASMALGTEAFRRRDDQGEAIAMAMTATQHIMDSFLNSSNSIECEEITNADFNSKLGLAKYMLTGKMFGCFNLAARWAPYAIEEAHKGLAIELPDYASESKSCASDVIKKMGGTDEEIVMVAGFAGGLGFSGNGCGALGAAIWKTTLDQVKKGEWKYTISNPTFDKILEDFYEASDYEMECSKICGKKFKTIDEHSEFIKNGGCSKIISILAKS